MHYGSCPVGRAALPQGWDGAPRARSAGTPDIRKTTALCRSGTGLSDDSVSSPSALEVVALQCPRIRQSLAGQTLFVG
jgi:hypothetical protein